MSTPVAQTIRRLPTFLASLALMTAPGAVTAQNILPEQYSQLRYRHIGPVGNRIASVAGVVGDPLTYYVGAASGGIWKSEDGGEYWRPIFDDQPDHAIGALAVAPIGSGSRVGRHGRAAHSFERVTGHGGLQIHRWRGELAAHGPRVAEPHIAHRHPPDQPRHRIRGGVGSQSRSAT